MSQIVQFQFASGDGQKLWPIKAEVGQSLLDVAWAAGLDVEGACEGAMACSTCHMIFTPDVHDKLPSAHEEEEDMLDITYGVTATSRLGCQILVREALEGATIYLPSATRNMM